MNSTTPGGCDCHLHIYDDAFALAATATFTPPHAPLADYLRMQRALGLTRAVLVQATGYGFDNACMLAALAQLGAHARGVVVVPPDVTEHELERLHGLGVRGVRFMMIPGAGGLLPWPALPEMAARIAPLGWHIDLQLDGRELPQHAARLKALPCKLVIDHTGKFLEPVPVQHAAFQALLDVLDQDQRWVKLAAPYETSRLGAPDYADVALLAKALVQQRPERCLWASNWPHPNRAQRPDDSALLGLLHAWAPEPRLREAILVANPARAYGF